MKRSEKSNRSRSYLMQAWKLDIRKIVLKLSKFNPQPFLVHAKRTSREDSVLDDACEKVRITTSYPDYRGS